MCGESEIEEEREKGREWNLCGEKERLRKKERERERE